MNLGQLLVWIVPLTLVSMLSPVLFVQAATIQNEHGSKGTWQFLGGNVAVLAVVGTASMGLFGQTVSNWVGHELASTFVDAVLGVLLLGYGCYLVLVIVRARNHPERGKHKQVAIPAHGIFAFGLLGAASDGTGLALFISIAQHVGGAAISWATRVLILAIVAALTLWAAWLPLVLGRTKGFRDIAARISRQLSVITRWTALAGSFLGGSLLLVHAFWRM